MKITYTTDYIDIDGVVISKAYAKVLKEIPLHIVLVEGLKGMCASQHTAGLSCHGTDCSLCMCNNIEKAEANTLAFLTLRKEVKV